MPKTIHTVYINSSTLSKAAAARAPATVKTILSLRVFEESAARAGDAGLFDSTVYRRPSVLIVEGVFADFDSHTDKEQAEKPCRCCALGAGCTPDGRGNHCC